MKYYLYSHKRLYSAVLAIIFLGCAVMFGYAAWVGNAADPTHLPLAVVYLLISGWMLVRAWRLQQNPETPEEGVRIKC
jgi:putative Ca2+/H+ antiporter (TMEM165/GDT1 family)